MLITLTCVFEGFPDPDVHWTYSGDMGVIALSDGGPYDIRRTVTDSGEVNATVTSTLEFFSRSVNDAGAYTCLADNGVVNLIQAQTNATSQLYISEEGEG